MKKLAVLLLVLVLAIGAYVAAGPYLTIRAIRAAVQAQDSSALAEQVDFPTLRGSLKAQLVDAMVRKAGPDAQSSLLGSIALRIGTGVANTAVDAMVNPAGLAALMEGRRVWRDARDSFSRPETGADGTPVADTPPLQDAEYHYESLSRFTATINDDEGRPVVFVLRRDGLQWRLADIRLPLD
jgi:hypothetical protein